MNQLRAMRLALLAGVLAAGCSPDLVRPETDPPHYVYSRPPLYAVTLPESAAVGDSIEIGVHLAAGGCYGPDSIWVEPAGDRRLRIGVRASQYVGEGVICLNDFRVMEVRVRAHLPAPGSWIVDVVGEDSLSAVVAVGAAPRVAGVHRFTIEPRTPGDELPPFVQVWWGSGWDNVDTVLVDPQGRGVVPLSCASAAERLRLILVPRDSRHYLFAPRADDCLRPLHSWFMR
ncbi:MAG: hypothetical protein ABIP29_12125 [Candidatus Eisenbacteria bacterium]